MREWSFESATEPTLRLTREFSLGVWAHSLLVDEQRLFAAGGSLGLMCVDLAGSAHSPRVLERGRGLWCTDVERAGTRILATFAAKDASRLGVYDARSLRRESWIELPEGTAWAVVGDQERAFVALGDAGLVMVDLRASAKTRVWPGPGAQAFSAPRHCQLTANWVRDLALSETHLFAAADGAGLALIDLAQSWSPGMQVALVPTSEAGEPSYAARVAWNEGRLFVGSNLGPAAMAEGAPFGAGGRMDALLSVGAIAESDCALGPSASLCSFEFEGQRLVERGRWLQTGGWLALVPRGDWCFGQILGEGLQVRSFEKSESAQASGEVVLTQRPVGLAVIDAVPSMQDPDLVLVSVDSAGSKAPGWPRLAQEGRIHIDPATHALAPLGLLVGAQWIDEESGLEWCLAGAPDGWRLAQVDALHPERTRAWPLQLEPDQDGQSGSGYFSSTIDGDDLYLTCAKSRFGLLGASAGELVRVALASPPGQSLSVAWKWRTQVHTGGDALRLYTWKPSVHRRENGARWLALPCGFDGDPSSPARGHARTVLFALGAEPGSAPQPLGTFHKATPGGHAIACAWFVHQGAPLLAVLDLVTGLAVVEAHGPSGPVEVGSWIAPNEVFDGQASNFLDLVLEQRTHAGTYAFIAAGRMGLVGIDLSRPRRFDLQSDFVLDTPGWAAGVHLDAHGGRRRLLLGDQKAGLLWLR